MSTYRDNCRSQWMNACHSIYTCMTIVAGRIDGCIMRIASAHAYLRMDCMPMRNVSIMEEATTPNPFPRAKVRMSRY